MAVVAIANEAAWLALRERHVGSSEVAALFDCSPFHSAWELWHVKAGRIPPKPVGGPRPKWGLRLETAIAEAVEEERGGRASRCNAYYSHETVRGLGCTPDFLFEHPDHDGPGLLETKNVDWLIHKRQWTDDEPPQHILLQLQTQLACAGRAWGWVASLVGGNQIATYPYARHDRIVAEIERRVGAFWASIDAGECPYKPDGSEASSYALKTLYRSTDPEPVDLSADNELPLLCETLKSAAALRLEYEKAEKAARNAILAKLGDHAQARCAGWWIKAPVTDVAEKFVAATTMRRLTVKEMLT